MADKKKFTNKEAAYDLIYNFLSGNPVTVEQVKEHTERMTGKAVRRDRAEKIAESTNEMIKKMLDQKIAPYLANRGFDMSRPTPLTEAIK